MKNIKKTVLLIILIVSFFIIFNSYFIFENKMTFLFKMIYFLIINLLFTIIFILFFLIKKNYKDYNKKTSSEFNKLFNYSNKLLNSFYNYYNNSLKHIIFFYDNQIDLKTEYKKEFDSNYIESENQGKIDILYKRIIEVLNVLNTIDKNLFKKISCIEDSNLNKSQINNIIMGFNYYSEIIINFLNSIIENINNSSKPLSEGIYIIKMKINSFLENITKLQNELLDEKSDRNFNNVIKKYSEQNENFNETVAMINNYYNGLENNLEDINHMISNIYENTNIIQDIAEVIRLLSINASIEATRAGESGKGFKIVSDEVKKLSNNTQLSIDKIVPMIKNTKETVSQVLNDFNVKCNEVINKINNSKKEFVNFYELLKNYYNNLNSLFTSVSDIIIQINNNIDSITPVFQNSNLTIQEMENLNKFIMSFLDENNSVINSTIKKLTDEEKNNYLKKLTEKLAKIITTESEIKVLNEILKKFGFDEFKYSKNNDLDIEMF